MSKVLTINESNFFEVTEKYSNILIKFYAPWCGPCRMIAPIIEELSDTPGTETKIAKINVDESPNLSRAFEIRGVPTFFFMKNGKSKNKFTGSLTKNNLISFIKENE